MTKKKITLVLFCFNEMEGLKHTLSKLNNKHKIFVIDGNSKDGTHDLLKKKKIKFFVQKSKNYNEAYHLAFKKTKTEFVIIYHPKKTFSILVIDKIKKEINKGFDFVFTSRMIEKAYNEEDKNLLKPRKWFGNLISFTVKLFFKSNIQNNLTDPLCGVRGFNRKKFKILNIKKNGVTADLEFFIKVFKNKECFTEIPIVEKSRLYGKTNFPAIKTGSKILIYLFKEILKRLF